MPPKIRFQKEDVLEAAFALTREKGVEALNARAVAKRLGCSTQPLFRVFASMEDVRQEMIRMSARRYDEYIAHSADYAPSLYLGTGMAYLHFAMDEPQLFKLLFMRDRVSDGSQQRSDDDTLDYILSVVMEKTGFSREKALFFHQRLWIFSYGLATMLATKYLTMSDDELMRLLRGQFSAVLAQETQDDESL